VHVAQCYRVRRGENLCPDVRGTHGETPTEERNRWYQCNAHAQQPFALVYATCSREALITIFVLSIRASLDFWQDQLDSPKKSPRSSPRKAIRSGLMGCTPWHTIIRRRGSHISGWSGETLGETNWAFHDGLNPRPGFGRTIHFCKHLAWLLMYMYCSIVSPSYHSNLAVLGRP